MKLNRIITLCAVAATLALSTSSLLAQQDTTGGNQGGQGGQRRNRQGGPGGGGNFDPAQMQQRILGNIQEQLGFTNDTEWDAVKPLVQKVVDARRDVGFGGMRSLFGGRNRGGDQGGNNRPNPFGQTSPEQEALQKAIDDNAPSAQIKDLLAKYKASQKAKQAKLEAAQADLKAVLTTKQEAQAYLLQLVN
jgi:Spy/CpxP family protein refolding chaperone